jgi:hypothetical protein
MFDEVPAIPPLAEEMILTTSMFELPELPVSSESDLLQQTTAAAAASLSSLAKAAAHVHPRWPDTNCAAYSE